MKKLFIIYQFILLHAILPLITCLIYCPLIILFILFKKYKVVGLLIQNWGWLCLKMLRKKYEVQGLENLDPNKRYLMISNHGSMVDIPLNAILSANPISWVLKAELLRVPIANQMFKLGVGIPISRDKARESQQQILERVQYLRKHLNPNIMIYPEGTRTKNGQIQSFKRGFAQVMRNYEMDILPITLSGVVGYYSNVQKIPNSDSPIKVTIHPVESYTQLKELTDKEITQHVQDIVASVYYP